MSHAPTGYAIGTPYTAGWYREQTPTWTTFVAEWQGYAAPEVERPLRYLDLGCGRGVTASWVAACLPHWEVWGVDFDPQHVAMARRYAEGIGSGARFVEAAFGAPEVRDLPRFDVVALHGVWSWITAERRAEVVALLARHVEPGGLVYVSYNALPGRATLLGLQRLLREASRRVPAAGDAGLGAGVALLDRVRDGAHFAAHRNALGLFDRFRSREPGYLAHEYLVDGWEPWLLADVARDLAPAGLEFVGSCNLAENIDALALAPAAAAKLEGVDDPVLRETLRDFLIDTGFRRDLFRRGAPQLPRSTQAQRLSSRRWALAVPRSECALDVRVPAGPATLAPEHYAPILDRLAIGAATGIEVTRDAGGGASVGQVLRRLGVLVAVGYVEPGLPDEGRDARIRSVANANGRSLALDEDDVHLASPATGSCVRLSRFEALLVEARSAADPASSALERLHAAGRRLLVDGAAVTDDARAIAEARAIADRFLRNRLPVLGASGVLS